ncbi:MAG: cupin domain-containing protein [Collimonas sp.]|uniref:cupin domain-containing protein n=1 Tax=Collimonas sp. TaxID=1963772 RepID=UPI0032672372
MESSTVIDSQASLPFMMVKELDRSLMRHEYGVMVCRLMEHIPSESVPGFGASVVEVPPHDAVTLHSHHEHEMWVLISGAGTFEVDGRRTAVSGTTLFYMKPHQLHSLSNDDAHAPLKFLSMWWD